MSQVYDEGVHKESYPSRSLYAGGTESQCLESTMPLGGHKNILISSKSRRKRDFPGDLVAKTLPPNAGGVGLTPGQGAKIPHALWPKSKT